jgi:hypothetical protein
MFLRLFSGDMLSIQMKFVGISVRKEWYRGPEEPQKACSPQFKGVKKENGMALTAAAANGRNCQPLHVAKGKTHKCEQCQLGDYIAHIACHRE